MVAFNFLISNFLKTSFETYFVFFFPFISGRVLSLVTVIQLGWKWIPLWHLKIFFVLYSSIVDEQRCVNFRCTEKWISYTCTCICFSNAFRLLQDIEQSSLCYTVSPVGYCFKYSRVYMSIQDSQEFGRHLWLPIFFMIFWCEPFLKSLLNLLLYFFCFGFWPQGTWDLSFPTRDQTCTPCMGRQSLNHWITGDGRWLLLRISQPPPPPYKKRPCQRTESQWRTYISCIQLILSRYCTGEWMKYWKGSFREEI